MRGDNTISINANDAVNHKPPTESASSSGGGGEGGGGRSVVILRIPCWRAFQLIKLMFHSMPSIQGFSNLAT